MSTRRLVVSILMLFSVTVVSADDIISVNFDIPTTGAMTASLLAELEVERLNKKSVDKILKHYTKASLATAGILAEKKMEYEALKNARLFDKAAENYYYQRIFTTVTAYIIPKFLIVSELVVRYPDKALYWGPYFLKLTEEVRQLCMIFECVVTNGKLSFRQVPFLVLKEPFRILFDLTKYGNIDWSALWDRLVSFGSGISKEMIMDDVDRIIGAGSSIAIAGIGYDFGWLEGCTLTGNVMQMKPREVITLYEQFRDYWDVFSKPANIRRLVQSTLLRYSRTGVSQLLEIGDYRITNYISNFLNEITGRYYRQRWYIYSRSSGSETLCSYTPPMDNISILYSGEWTPIFTIDPSYMPTAAEMETIMSNSERHAGITRAEISRLNSSDPRYRYWMSASLQSCLIYRGGRMMGKAFAYSIQAFKQWDFTDTVYEDYFDSRTMTEYHMTLDFQSRLEEYNDNDEGIVYSIGKGEKDYYEVASNDRLQNCSSVSFSTVCDEGIELQKGVVRWKEGGYRLGFLDESAKAYAMATTISSDSPDTQEVEAQISSLTSEITALTEEIRNMQSDLRQLRTAISTAPISERAALSRQYSELSRALSEKQSLLRQKQSALESYQSMLQEMYEDYYDVLDGTMRIPAVMHQLEGTYGIHWEDAGSWEGFTFIRKGTTDLIQGELVFRAVLTLASPPRIKLGRVLHRAVLQVSWSLSSEYQSDEIVDVLYFQNGESEEQKKQAVDARFDELQAEYPACHIDIFYAYEQDSSAPADDRTVHLLWVSDRLAIAREVDHRLVDIYARLGMMETFLASHERVLDFLRRDIAYAPWGRLRNSVARECYREWIEKARDSGSYQSQ